MMLAWAVAAQAGDEERGRWDAEVALDVLHAGSTSEAPSSGPTPGLSATELGMRVLGSVESGAVEAAVDYQGREAVAGTFQTVPFRLFYRAEVVGTLARDRVELAAGRFVAPSVVFLPVDGARVAWRPSEHASVQLFGGRRGVSTARRSLEPGTLLPAVGGAGAWLGDRGSAEVLLSFAGDEALLPGVDPEAADTVDTWNALAGTVRAQVEPVDDAVLVGATATVTQRASFVFLPTAGSAQVTAQALDLFQGLGYLRWRPSRAARVDLDLLRQEAALDFGGADTDPEAPGVQLPGGFDVTLVDPTFTDVRARAALAAGEHVWLRPDARLRLRPGRTELRYGVGADLADLVLDGPFVRARAWLEDIGMGGLEDDVGAIDRVYWSGSGGWSSGPLEAELGASRTDRALAPVSARTTAATTSDDLSPFVLAAQDVGFARLFVTDRSRWGGWFAGLDAEMNLTAEPEVRAFVQVGLLGDGSW
jgi:hypothetical protein